MLHRMAAGLKGLSLTTVRLTEPTGELPKRLPSLVLLSANLTWIAASLHQSLVCVVGHFAVVVCLSWAISL